MARKVFISFLGTNNYLDTHYELGGRQSSLVRFIQEALLELAFNDWTSDDHIYIFGTDGDEGSYKKNWLDNGQSDKNGPIIQPGLKTQLTNMGLKTPFDFEFIPEGFSSDDVWKMMEIITGKLEQGDEIHLDVTHAFRSIPMLATTLFNYTQFMLGTTLASVHYGAFEKLGPVFKVKGIPEDDRFAPIIDMTDIVRLQDFTDAASSLKQFGRVVKISEQLSKVGNQMQRKYQMVLVQVGKEISKLDNYISTCRIADIRRGKYKKTISNNLKGIKSLAIPTPVKQLVDQIELETSNFVPFESDKNIEAAIRWSIKYNMFAQAYTLIREYLCIRVAHALAKYSSEFDPAEENKEFREFVSKLLSINQKDVAACNFKDELKVHLSLTQKLLGDQMIQTLRSQYKHLADARNIINHGKGKQDWEYFKKELKYYDEYLKTLKAYGCEED